MHVMCQDNFNNLKPPCYAPAPMGSTTKTIANIYLTIEPKFVIRTVERQKPDIRVPKNEKIRMQTRPVFKNFLRSKSGRQNPDVN